MAFISKYHTTKITAVTKKKGKQNSACRQIDISQPVVLGLIYAAPQILLLVILYTFYGTWKKKYK